MSTPSRRPNSTVFIAALLAFVVGCDETSSLPTEPTSAGARGGPPLAASSALDPAAPLPDPAEVIHILTPVAPAGQCVPSCGSRQCGPDGCGGSCGLCSNYAGRPYCHRDGMCEATLCEPECEGKTCGPDGCGGVCGTCDIGESGGSFVCRRTIGSVTTTIAAKLVEAQYPAYTQVVPQDNRRLVTVDRAQLAGAIERAVPLCSGARGATLQIADGKLLVVAGNGDVGSMREGIAADFVAKSCDGFEIGTNPRYLADALKSIDAATVTLAFSDDDKPLKNYDNKGGAPTKASQLCPVLVRATEDAAMFAPLSASYLSVVMPMRV